VTTRKNGVIQNNDSITGTYKVSANCTGLAIETGANTIAAGSIQK